MDVDASRKRYKALKKYIEEVLVDGEDYGSIPGVEKPFLFKSGAQKLCMLFGYAPHYECLGQIEDWKGEKHGEPLFFYKFSCVLSKDRQPVGEGIGSANSWESKYRYRWVKELPKDTDSANVETRSGTISEFAFAVNKAETTGQYGKPKEYWDRWHAAITSGEARSIKKRTSGGKEMDAWEMGGTLYRIPNDGFPDVINTVQKQAEKRAYVEATLSATGASQFFTQDEDNVQAQQDAQAPPQSQPKPKTERSDPTPGPSQDRSKTTGTTEPQSAAGKAWAGGHTITPQQWRAIYLLLQGGDKDNPPAEWIQKACQARYGKDDPLQVSAEYHADFLQFAALLKACMGSEAIAKDAAKHCGALTVDCISPEKLGRAMDFVNGKPASTGKLQEPY
jgi:hypothetical protein